MSIAHYIARTRTTNAAPAINMSDALAAPVQKPLAHSSA